MSETEDLKRRIMEEYVQIINPVVGENTALANRLTSDLDGILDRELGKLPDNEAIKEPAEVPQLDYSRLGPFTNDGNRYTLAQILEMRIDIFAERHTGLDGTDKSILHDYFNQVAKGHIKGTPWAKGMYGSRADHERIKNPISKTKEQALDFIGVTEEMFDIANEFLQKHYGISLGTKIDEVELARNKELTDARELYTTQGPCMEDGQRYTTAQILGMDLNYFLRTHRDSLKQDGVQSSMTRYFRRVDGHSQLEWGDQTKVIDAIQISPFDSGKLRGIGNTTIEKVNQYFQNNYDMTLGTKFRLSSHN